MELDVSVSVTGNDLICSFNLLSLKFWQHHLRCEVKRAESFLEAPPLHHYSEGSDYSDDSAFVGVFNTAVVDHLIIRLVTSTTGG